jgi:hypothetical protein
MIQYKLNYEIYNLDKFNVHMSNKHISKKEKIRDQFEIDVSIRRL